MLKNVEVAGLGDGGMRYSEHDSAKLRLEDYDGAASVWQRVRG